MMSLRLKKEVYRQSKVVEAVQAYKGIAEIDVEEQTEYWQLTFDRCRYDEWLTIKEFENYLIGVENI